MKPTREDLRNRFLYHPPKTEAQRHAHEEVSRRTLELAEWFVDNLPEGRHLSIVLTLIEDVRMRANASLACDDPERRHDSERQRDRDFHQALDRKD